MRKFLIDSILHLWWAARLQDAPLVSLTIPVLAGLDIPDTKSQNIRRMYGKLDRTTDNVHARQYEERIEKLGQALRSDEFWAWAQQQDDVFTAMRNCPIVVIRQECGKLLFDVEQLAAFRRDMDDVCLIPWSDIDHPGADDQAQLYGWSESGFLRLEPKQKGIAFEPEMLCDWFHVRANTKEYARLYGSFSPNILRNLKLVADDVPWLLRMSACVTQLEIRTSGTLRQEGKLNLSYDVAVLALLVRFTSLILRVMDRGLWNKLPRDKHPMWSIFPFLVHATRDDIVRLRNECATNMRENYWRKPQ